MNKKEKTKLPTACDIIDMAISGKSFKTPLAGRRLELYNDYVENMRVCKSMGISPVTKKPYILEITSEIIDFYQGYLDEGDKLLEN